LIQIKLNEVLASLLSAALNQLNKLILVGADQILTMRIILLKLLNADDNNLYDHGGAKPADV